MIICWSNHIEKNNSIIHKKSKQTFERVERQGKGVKKRARGKGVKALSMREIGSGRKEEVCNVSSGEEKEIERRGGRERGEMKEREGGRERS